MDRQDVLIRDIDPALYRDLRKTVIDRSTSVQAVLKAIVEDGIREYLTKESECRDAHPAAKIAVWDDGRIVTTCQHPIGDHGYCGELIFLSSVDEPTRFCCGKDGNHGDGQPALGLD
jgi:hypothetical protein